MYKLGKANYKNSLVNFTASIMKYYGQTPFYPTQGLVDFILSKKYRHVVVIVLDGLGTKIIDKNLGNGSILKTHQIIKMNSVYPSTTVAATTAIQTGKAPIESGWLGWHLYFAEEDPSLVLFQNKEYYTGNDFTKYKVTDKINNTPFYQKLKKATSYEIYPAFKENGANTFSEGIDRVLNIVNKDEANFTYFYWDNPDTLMHEYGTTSQIVKVNLIDIESEIERLNQNLPDDTVIFITADHGQVDVEPIDVTKEEINEYLRKPIAGEGRMTSFYLQDGSSDEFVKAFNKFNKYFNLYSKQEFLDSKLAGLNSPHVTTQETLGDYIAVAIDKYFFTTDYNPNDFTFKGHHAGLTEDEMIVPLVLLKRKDEKNEEEEK